MRAIASFFIGMGIVAFCFAFAAQAATVTDYAFTCDFVDSIDTDDSGIAWATCIQRDESVITVPASPGMVEGNYSGEYPEMSGITAEPIGSFNL